MSDSINDGGPAFPVPGWKDDAEFNGMSLRDHFAGLAMQALIADPLRADQSREECARLSYLMAAAMLRARNTT